MTDTKKLTGIVTALLTPFDENQKLNKTGLRQVVQYNLRAGVSAFYVCGTTGEGFLMTSEERREVVEIVVDEIAGRAGVIVNVSHMQPAVTLELASHAHQSGADALSTLPPLFYPLTQQDILRYYRSLLDQCELPLTIYNIPVFTNKPLDMAMAEKLSEHENFLGIKYSCSETGLLNQFKQIAGGRLLVWSGNDDEIVAGLSMGSDGAIGSTYNLVGDLAAEIIRSYRRGEVDRALQIQTRYNEFVPIILKYGIYRTVKRALTLMGIDAGICRDPFGPVDPAVDSLLREALEQFDQLRKDFGLAPVG